MGWVLGALLSIAGSVASNLGVNIQKYSFIRQARFDPAQRASSHWKDVYWLSGLGLVVFGSLGDFLALSMVAQSIVAPLASTTLVTNVIFAHYWLHERVGRRELIGTGLIIIGSTLSVVFGDHNTRSYTDHDLVRLIGGGWFLAYFILVIALCVAGLMLHRKITPIKKNLVEAIRRYEIAVEANNAQGADWEDEVIARLEKEYKRWEKLHPFALCALSGAFGAQSVLFGKCFAELLSTTFQGNNQMFNIFPYVALLCMGATVATQLHFLAIALNYFDALYAVPVFQCFFIGVSTLGGALYFREVYEFSAGEAFAFVIGLLLTLAGVAVLSTRQMSQRNIVHRVASEFGADEGIEFELDMDTALPGVRRTTRVFWTDGAGSEPAVRVAGERAAPHREFEMSDIGAKRQPGVTATPPTLKSTAQLGNTFSEQAAQEQQELSDLTKTIDATKQDLAAKLAQAGYGTGAAPTTIATTDSELPLLHPVSAPMTPALAIQIEADQAYINRQEDKSLVGGTAPLSQAAQKVRQALAARIAEAEQHQPIMSRTDRDLEILTLAGGMPQEGSPRPSRAGSIAAGGYSSSGEDSDSRLSRAETPRSHYVQERERAASVASSGRNSPNGPSGTTTPRRGAVGDSDYAGDASDTSPALHTRHLRTGSMIGVTPKGGSVVRPVAPSAIFSGAFLESAQELPDIDEDTRLQRLTRLSTVGHWVAGLHAQMPVAGGVVQAILQAKEMQAAIAEEDKKHPSTAAAASGAEETPSKETRIDMPGGDVELAEKPMSASRRASLERRTSLDRRVSLERRASLTNTATQTAELSSPATSASASAATATSTAAHSAVVSSPAAAPVNRVIEFHDDYDIFSTQYSKKPSHRDPLARSSDTTDTMELESPTATLAALKPQIHVRAPSTSSTGAPASVDSAKQSTGSTSAASTSNASLAALFSPLPVPLAVTTHHPLQEGAAPSPAPTPLAALSHAIDSVSALTTTPFTPSIPVESATASPVPPTAASSSPLLGSTSSATLPLSPPVDPAGESSSLVGPDASVEEWRAALRIQSVLRGRNIRRSLRGSSARTSLASTDFGASVPFVTAAATTNGGDIEQDWELTDQQRSSQEAPSASPIDEEDVADEEEVNLV